MITPVKNEVQKVFCKKDYLPFALYALNSCCLFFNGDS